jgi:DNA-binding Xre family transcriptional regulator
MRGWVVLSQRAVERVWQLMAERRIRDTETLAAKTGSDERTLRRALRRERVQRRTVAEIAAALGVDVTEILGDTPEPLEGELFRDWLRDGGRWGLWIAIAGSAAAVFASTRPRDPASPPWATFLIQAATVLAILAWQSRRNPREFDDPPLRVRIASIAARQFVGYFRLAWVFWAAFYIWFAATALPAAGRFGWPILDALQNAGTLSLVACYEVLSHRTVPRSDAPRRSRLVLYGWCVVALLLALELGAQAWAPGTDAQRFFALASGLGQGIALALLTGRLDHAHVGAGTGPILGLYTYACIQGTYAMFPGDTVLEHALTVTALPLKCLLCLVLAWCTESGILWYYVARLRAADEVLVERRRIWLRAHRDGVFRGPEFEATEAAPD